METRRFFDMRLYTSLGNTRLVRIPEPAPHINAEVAGHFTEELMSISPFDETIGDIVGLHRADIVTEQRITLV